MGSTLNLRLEIDGQVVLEDRFETSSVLAADSHPYFDELDLQPGDRQIRLSLTDPTSATTFVYFNEQVTLAEDESITIPPPGG